MICPSKAKFFMWCIMENKAPTWDNLKQTHIPRPRWCLMCKECFGNVRHIFMALAFHPTICTD